jgi:hypothetical protein
MSSLSSPLILLTPVASREVVDSVLNGQLQRRGRFIDGGRPQ